MGSTAFIIGRESTTWLNTIAIKMTQTPNQSHSYKHIHLSIRRRETDTERQREHLFITNGSRRLKKAHEFVSYNTYVPPKCAFFV